jgi:hypothetical protein
MRYPLLLAALGCCVCWIGIAAAQAQTTTTPGMGPTSPLNVPSADSSSSNSTSSGLGGIPLGSTEINTPGVSPLIMPCPSASSNAAFDGGGSNQSNNCGSGASTTSASNAPSTSGAGGMSPGSSGSVVGSGITLGATDLGTPGESQTTPVPTATPCLQSMTSQGSSTGSGPTASTVNGGC